MGHRFNDEHCEDVGTDQASASAESETGLTRRRALQVGAVAVGSLAFDAASAHGDSGPSPWYGGRLEVSFDEDWLFLRGDATGAQAVAFDDGSWQKLALPHDWSIEDLPYATSTDGAATADPSLFDYTSTPAGPDVPVVIGPFDPQNSAGGSATGYTVGGIGWYRKHFDLTRPGRHSQGSDDWVQQRHVELRFDGVYEDADVWLNGVHLGFHPNGYTSFAYDLTPYLNPTGANVLAVRVNNSGKNSRWYSGSGIYRHTWLTSTAAVRIPLWGVFVSTPTVAVQRSVAHVEAQATNLGASSAVAEVLVTVTDPHGRRLASRSASAQSLAAGSTASYAVDVPITGARLWSPESPSLYQARTDVFVGGRLVDSVSTTFGIRALEFNGTDGFLLNGTPTKVRGACIHHSFGPMGAVALDRSNEREIEVLQQAGFNAIRTAHNPPAPALLEACDRLGMLVWDEFSDMWDAAKNPDDYHLYFPQYWQQDLTGMILRDRNHPSVIIWSLGNEINDTTNGQRGTQMAALVHSLDQTRPVSQGAQPFTSITNPMYQYVDVADVHYDLPSPNKDALHAAYPTKAMTQSESWPATIYDDFQLALDNPWFVGSWVWAGWDYLGEAGAGAPIYAANDQNLPVFGNGLYPWFQDFQGDIDLIGQRKPQNYWRSVVYGSSPLELLVERPAPAGTQQFANNWSYYDELRSWTWDVPEGQDMTVHAYTTGDSVTLLLNGSPVATNPVTAADKRVSTFTVPYAPGELTAVASRNGQEIGQQTLRTTGAPAALRVFSDTQVLTTGRDDLAHVLVEVLDGHGRRVPDAVVSVSFQVTGAGELVAVGNGNPHNIDSFKRSGRYTWHGQALAILRPAKTRGRLTLTATAPGLRPATVSLPVLAAPDAFVTSHSGRRWPWSARTTSVAGVFGGPLMLAAGGGAFLRRRLQTGDRSPNAPTDPPEN